MKKGTFVLIATAFAYTLALLFILTYGFRPDAPFVGQKALEITTDLSFSQKIYAHLDQSARNAISLTLTDFEKDGFFDRENCLFEKETVVLFSAGSCVLTQKSFADFFTKRFLHHYPSFFQQPVYGLQISSSLPAERLSVRLEKDILTLAGSFPDQTLSYRGKRVSYTIPYSFSESVSTSLSDIFSMYATTQEQLSCLVEHKADALQRCALSSSGTWTFHEENGFLFVTATSQRNVSFSFAINLNTVEKTQPKLFT